MSRRHDDAADLVVLDPFEHAALVHVAVDHDLVDVAHRRRGWRAGPASKTWVPEAR
jgi:hypothetical protein